MLFLVVQKNRNNPAENLLKAEGTHKWRTATVGETNATVILQFEKASQIHSVDIGNEGSAFVEVLVGKSTSSLDYQVLLVSSSFMNPADSRNGTNRNTVRIFGPDKLSKPAALEKWDRVKIVCAQPFNKTSTYGLSFIKFHSPPDTNKPTENEGVKRLGAFVIKTEEEEDDDIKVGSLFSNRGQMDVTPVTPKGAAAVRAASRVAEETRARARDSNSSASGSQSSPKVPAAAKQSTSKTPAKQSTLTPPAKASPGKGRNKHIMSDEGSDTEEETITPPKTSLKRTSTTASSHSPETPPPLKKIKTEPAKSSPVKEFGKLMDKVVFVLSGFQNPYRAELREKALEMGAQYRPDWGRGCTHLVCAFTNTPKYNQVKGHGHIVDKAWILDCYKKKKLLPWQSYSMVDAESPGSSSDDEAIPSKPVPKRTSSSSSKGSSSSIPQSSAPNKKISTSNESTGHLYGDETDSPDDTDEEIRRAKVKVAAKKAKDTKVEAKQEEEVNVKRLPVKDRDTSEVKREEKVNATLQLYADSTDEDEPNLFSCSTLAVDDDSGQEQGAASATTSSAFNHRTLAATVPVGDNEESAATVSVDDDSKPATSDTVPIDDFAEDSEKRKGTVSVKEENDESDSGLPDLPDFFENMHFFFYGNFDPQERRLLARYIAAYNGVLEDYMNKRVKYIITCERWDDNFEEALLENPELVFVKPKWIHSCHEKSKLVPYQLFVVVP
ncbi:hypothetical protein C0Q70_12956 [Pomacea canaliculata]|uniref:DNA repair protein XRCC1 n=1 Tax=Pomacea canaliculata TaxID=400727 RepID=A0A2T7P318_POMCA|nr:DNA repair protein XRCC1-like [Pomacea canaliculata]PVD27783.1 hypothetical protein C0Q70_12956 [Pomacea canaliculata]